MKKDIFKSLIILLVFSLVFTFSCDNKSTNGGSEGNDFDALVGTWHSQSATVDILVETNSNQTANDLFSQADGKLEVEGEYTTDLKYMLDVYMEGIRLVMISEDMLLTMLMKPTSSTSMLTLSAMTFGDEIFGSAVYDVVSNGDSTSYIGNFEDFDLSQTQAQVTANDAIFVSGFASPKVKLDNAKTATVTMSGTITAATMPISANDPTSILPFALPLDATDIGTVTLNDDSTFSADFTMEDFVEIDTTINGRWYIEDDKLILAPPEGEAGEPLELDYELDGNNLIVTAVIALSEFLGEVDTGGLDVLGLLESVLGLDPGSLEDVIVEVEITMSKGAGKVNFNKGEKSPWFDDDYRNQEISRILHQMDAWLKR